MKKLTSRIIRSFAHELTDFVDARIIDKRKSAEMQMIAYALDLMGIMDQKKFLEYFAITIGNRIYLPFTPGKPHKAWLPEFQIMLLGHECEHVLQWQDDPGFVFRYLGSQSRRAHYEADALHVNLEIIYYLTGRPCSISWLMRPMKNYLLRSADLRVMRKNLNLYNRVVSRGMVGTEVGKQAIKILKALS